MCMININGNFTDSNYRYKIPSFNITIGGKGNGIYTTFNNIDEISQILNHPTEILLSYLAKNTGTSYKKEKNQLTGTHTIDNIHTLILEYVKYLIMCPECNIPETIPIISSNLCLQCASCKYEKPVISANFRINHGINIISRYLSKHKSWTIHVSPTTLLINNSKDDISEMFDIFDIL